jgi:hypothetical protein
MIIDLTEMMYESQERERALDEFVFWIRYLPILDHLLDKQIESIKEYIMQNPFKFVKTE